MKKHATVVAMTLAVASVALAGSAVGLGTAVKVQVGSATSGNHPITANSTSSQVWGWYAAGVTCSEIQAGSSTLNFASGGAGVSDVMSLGSWNFGNCLGPGGNLALASSGTWKFHADRGATAGSSDQVQGHLDDATLRVSLASNPQICDFTVTGSMRAYFDEAQQTIDISEPGASNGAWRVSKVTRPCLGKIQVGNPLSWKGTLKVTSPDGPIRIG